MTAAVIPLRAGETGAFDEAAPPPPDSEQKPRRGGPGGDAPTKEGKRFGPVVPLGVRTRRGTTAYVFFDAAGRESILGARDIYTPAMIRALFGGAGAMEFLESQWPHMVKVVEDGETAWVPRGFSVRDAGDDLVAACTKRGSADDIELRRDGIWPAPQGGLIVHCGSHLYVGDQRVPTGLQHGNVVYINAQQRVDPAPDPATVADGRALEQDLALWTFKAEMQENGPRLVLGMVACGILSAALPWRPHMAIWGPAGAGKTTLCKWIAAACGAADVYDDMSKAGIQRMFSSRSGLIPLDENEANAGQTEFVLGLMRGASSGAGARIVRARGESSTEVDVFRIAGCFVLAAINPPHLALADASRITMISLRRGPEENRDAALQRALRRARDLYPALVTRLVLGFARYQQDVRVLRDAAIDLHATSRSADQMAALIAGWQALTTDAPITPAEARDLVADFSALLTQGIEAEEEDQGRQVLRQLLGSVVQVDRDKRTVASAIVEGMDAIRKAERAMGTDPDIVGIDAAAKRWKRVLGQMGLRWSSTPHPGIYIANGAPVIESAFTGTPWAKWAWQRPLRELPDAYEPASSLKFPGNAQARCVFLPAELLGLDDDG